MPLFSIVVPAFNASSTLRETLESVGAQTLVDWELIVVNDGSTDDTALIAESFAVRDLRVRVLNQENRGSAGAYNSGVAAAIGELVTICSADDLLLPEHLAGIAALAAAHPECSIFSSNGYYSYADGSRRIVYAATAWKTEHSLSLEDVIRGCFFSVGATYRRRLFDEISGYHDVYGEDYDFWLRAMAHGARHCYTPAATSVHRLTAAQKSADIEKVARSDIRILTDLSESGVLSDSEREIASRSIGRHEKRLRAKGLTLAERAAKEADDQARRIHAALAARIGDDRADAVIASAHRASWFLRPIRIFLHRMALAARRLARKK